MAIHRMTDIPASEVADVISDFELEGFTVTKIDQGNGLFTVEARKGDDGGQPVGDPGTQTGTTGTDPTPGGGTSSSTGGTSITSPTDLLKRLAAAYKTATIQHPQLRAVTLAQWLLESGRATSDLAKLHLNFGGLKFRPEMAPFATSVSFQAHDGVDDYCKFASIEKFIQGYWAFLDRSPYAGKENHVSSGESFIRFIGPIYTPTPGYADTVLSLVAEATGLLSGAGAGTGDPSPAGTGETSTAGAVNLGTIVIDPGHGGTSDLSGSSHNNAKALSGALEKTLTLQFATLLQSALVSQAQAANEQSKVVLTRTTDMNVTGAGGAGTALTQRAKLFLSIHFNGDAPTARGTETFFRAAENGNVNLEDDKAFARDVQSAVFGAIKALDGSAADRGAKPDSMTKLGKLAVLSDINLGNAQMQNKCRAALLEVEFITNPAADQLLVSGPSAAANRAQVMAALATRLRQHMKAMG